MNTRDYDRFVRNFNEAVQLLNSWSGTATPFEPITHAEVRFS